MVRALSYLLFYFYYFYDCIRQVPAKGFFICVTTVSRNITEFAQYPAISRRQKRSIQRIQQHLRNYRDNPYIELTNQEITQYLWHLGAIITITTDHKIALKVIAIDKLLRKIRIYRKKNGTPVVPKRPLISSKRNHFTSNNQSMSPQKMEKLLQTIPSGKPSSLSKN